MSTVAQRAALGALFTGWTTPIAWPNRELDPPPASNWIRVTMMNTDANQMELGGDKNQHRNRGVVIVNVFTPLNKGDGDALTLAESVATIFRTNKHVATGVDGSMIFRDPLVEPVGPDGADGSYYQVNVTVPFVRDTVY